MEARSIRETLKEAITFSESKLNLIECRTEPDPICILLHYLKIIDLSKSLQRLPTTGISKSVFVLIVRATIETWARLAYGVTKPERIIDLELESLDSEIALQRVFDIKEDSTGRPFDLATYLCEQESKMSDLKKRGAKRLHISQIFEAINGVEVYKSVYKHLCQAPHSSLFSLIGDYFRVDPTTNTPHFLIPEILEPDALFPHYHAQCTALCHGAVIVHQYFGTGEAEGFQRLLDRLLGLAW